MADVHHKRCPKDMDPMWGQCACDVIDGLLADLRAKVRLIPAHAVRMENKWMNGRGWVPTAEVIVTVPLADVLALIEEVQR